MKFFGKRVQGQGVVTSLAPSWPVNVALLVIKLQVNSVQCLALVDAGCSQSIVSADQCMAWSSQQVDMWTIDGTSRACCGVRTVSILKNGGGHAIVNVLVASERPLGYDLLIRIDAIQVLGGITITPAGDLVGRKEVCVAICISEPDFDASFDHNERIWTARWKLDSEPHTKLQNIRYPITSGESTRGNCKCGSRTVG